MATLTSEQLISDVGRDVIGEIAPQELPLYRANSTAYFKDPQKALSRQESREQKLGFGAGTSVTLLTPVVLAVLTEVVKFVSDEVKKNLQEEGSELIGETIKGMFRKFRAKEAVERELAPDAAVAAPVPATEPSPEPAETPPRFALSAEQIAAVRRIAVERAALLRLSERTAQLLADSIAASLVVAPS